MGGERESNPERWGPLRVALFVSPKLGLDFFTVSYSVGVYLPIFGCFSDD